MTRLNYFYEIHPVVIKFTDTKIQISVSHNNFPYKI